MTDLLKTRLEKLNEKIKPLRQILSVCSIITLIATMPSLFQDESDKYTGRWFLIDSTEANNTSLVLPDEKNWELQVSAINNEITGHGSLVFDNQSQKFDFKGSLNNDEILASYQIYKTDNSTQMNLEEISTGNLVITISKSGILIGELIDKNTGDEHIFMGLKVAD